MLDSGVQSVEQAVNTTPVVNEEEVVVELKRNPVSSPAIALKKTASLPNLSALKKQALQPQKPATDEDVKEEELEGETLDLPIDVEALQKVWTTLAQSKKEEGRDQLFMLMNQAYEFKENTILLNLTSPLQEDLINEYRTEIVQFLRSNLKNKQLNITTRLVKAEARKMIYTPQEKFNYLAEKHPALLVLKDKFSLDPDF